MVDFYGFHVGRYTSPMDPVGRKVNDNYFYVHQSSQNSNPSITTIAAEGTTKIAPHGGSRRVAAEEMVQKTVLVSPTLKPGDLWRCISPQCQNTPGMNTLHYLPTFGLN